MGCRFRWCTSWERHCPSTDWPSPMGMSLSAALPPGSDGKQGCSPGSCHLSLTASSWVLKVGGSLRHRRQGKAQAAISLACSLGGWSGPLEGYVQSSCHISISSWVLEDGWPFKALEEAREWAGGCLACVQPCQVIGPPSKAVHEVVAASPLPPEPLRRGEGEGQGVMSWCLHSLSCASVTPPPPKSWLQGWFVNTTALEHGCLMEKWPF